MVWTHRYLKRIDWRAIVVISLLMTISLVVISGVTFEGIDPAEEGFFTRSVVQQMRGFALGALFFIFFAGFDYNKLREWAWILYALTIFSLIGLFFSGTIANVHRWYRLPLIGFNFQPSEAAKLSVVIAMSWLLERRKAQSTHWSTSLYAGLVVLLPFVLILKQPDLGSALVLLPVALVIFYFGDVRSSVIRLLTILGSLGLGIVLMIFLGIISYESARPVATKFFKEYQYERLNPDTHHQRAAQDAIAIGGFTGTGWRKAEFSSGGFLPAPYTDSVFSSLGEEWGFIGLFSLIALFYALIYFSFQVTAVAKDHFGRLLAAGVTIYLAMHIIINIGMMSGLLPITGVPLVLITYGGSSASATMAALGILQSIYSRRFMF